MEPLAHVMIAVVMLSIISAARIHRQTPVLNPTVARRLTANSCIYGDTTYEQQGICVDYTYCSPEHFILEGGNIVDSEFRMKKSKGCHTDRFEWCCTEGNVTEPRKVTLTDSGCTAPVDDSCPWCAALYTKPTPFTLISGLYCMGSLIASNVILTASTCILQVHNTTLFARIPGSPYPNRDYNVLFRKYHPEYRSDTHENDFGLLFLEKEVEWKDKKWVGACLNFQPVTSGECYAIGVNRNDQLVSSILTLTEGKCPNGGGQAPEAICGSAFEVGYCSVVTGSPILCGRERMLVSAVARTPCLDGTALLGSLSSYKYLLEKELANVNLTREHYILNEGE